MEGLAQVLPRCASDVSVAPLSANAQADPEHRSQRFFTKFFARHHG